MVVLLLSLVIIALAVIERTSPNYDPVDSAAVACPPDRVLVRIYGTHSSGDFEVPWAPRVLDLDPPRPPADLAQAIRNHSFDSLLGAVRGCPTLTFSYDETYLPAPESRPGVNAWNNSASPWNSDPERLADALDDMLKTVHDADHRVTFDIVSYSAGGIVPTYWAARGLDEERTSW